jgi:hypothetical protein
VTAYYVAAGTYWLAFNIDTSSILRYLINTTPHRYKALAYTTGFDSPWPHATDTHTTDTPYFGFVTVQIKAYVKLTKATLSEGAASVTSMSLYFHATGNFRAAIYTDSSGPADLEWESGSIPATGGGAWDTVLISAGTPNTLALVAGDYWLAWQWDSVNAGPSYAVGGANTGAYLAQAYGAFPDPLTGETLSTENWSIYVTYLEYEITGVVRDGLTGTPIASAMVWLFKTSDKSYQQVTTSDGSGNYTFYVDDNVTAYFIRAFKDGSNVFGTTDDDLVGA